MFLANLARKAVRRRLAGNTSLLRQTQVLLAKDPNPLVRRRLAANQALHKEAKELLLKDTNPWVLMCLAKNHTLNEAELRMLIEKSKSDRYFSARTKSNIACNFAAPVSILLEFYKENDANLNRLLCINVNTPNTVIKTLLTKEQPGDNFSATIIHQRENASDLLRAIRLEYITYSTLNEALKNYEYKELAYLINNEYSKSRENSNKAQLCTLGELIDSVEELLENSKQKEVLLKLAKDWSGCVDDLLNLDALL